MIKQYMSGCKLLPTFGGRVEGTIWVSGKENHTILPSSKESAGSYFYDKIQEIAASTVAAAKATQAFASITTALFPL